MVVGLSRSYILSGQLQLNVVLQSVHLRGSVHSSSRKRVLALHSPQLSPEQQGLAKMASKRCTQWARGAVQDAAEPNLRAAPGVIQGVSTVLVRRLCPNSCPSCCTEWLLLQTQGAHAKERMPSSPDALAEQLTLYFIEWPIYPHFTATCIFII